MALMPTSWDDLDWDDINPWDRRYYLSLNAALTERYYIMWLTPPLATNTYNTNTYCNRNPAVINNGIRNYCLRQYFDFYSFHNSEGCKRLLSFFQKLLGQYYYHNFWPGYGVSTADYKYGYFPTLQDYKVRSSNHFEIEDFYGEDFIDIFKSPYDGANIDSDRTINWLKKMKEAIQQLRYIEINGSNFFTWLYGSASERNDSATLAEVADLAYANITDKADAESHWYNDDSAFISAQYKAAVDPWAYTLHSVSFEMRDIRWVNRLQYPVDVYAAIYDYKNPLNGLGTNKIYHDFGTGFVNGEIRFLQTVQPGAEIGHFFDSISVIPDAPMPASGQELSYSIGIKLIADAGPYFNFKSDEGEGE
ncbi:MAG: hypothetical protein WCR17_04560 [Candidatus Methanomethylophilaceae archaeon]